MYGQLVVTPNVEFAALSKQFECAKITDMSPIDLARFRFDFDLTLAVLLMHADGTIYHRYGGRNHDDPLGWMSVQSLRRVMRRTLAEHRAESETRGKRPAAGAEPAKPRTVFDLPIAKRYFRKGRPQCVHCHTVHEVEQAQSVADDSWRKEKLWIYPAPERVGLSMDAEQQDVVRAVLPSSPAEAAGLRAGDRIVALGIQGAVATIADIQWALHNAPFGSTKIPVKVQRPVDGEADPQDLAVDLRVDQGWKRSSTSEYAWRPFKWGLSPAPGFGGPPLNSKQKRQAGIAETAFAFRVQYMVTWGRHAHRGRAAAQAGIRKGDIIVSFAGKRDFESIDHFHAFVRLECRAGQEVEVERIRNGQRAKLTYRLPN